VTGEPDPTGYWEARRYRDQVEERYRGSVLLAQGFDDLNVPPGNQFPWIERLESRGVPVKLSLGWYAHSNPDQAGGDARRADWADVVLRWFDRWLKGADVDTGPPVEVQDSEGRWRAESTWPPEGPPRALHLGADGSLHDTPPQATGERLLVPDPAHTQVGVFTLPSTPLDADCPIPSCAAFTLRPVAEQLHFAGRPALDLTVTPSADAGHVSAYLYAVDGGGARRIGWGQADVRFPDGDGRRRTATPGRAMRLRLDLQPLDSVVPAGAKLVLVLSQGAAYDRNPSVPTAPLRLSLGGEASTLRLALVE
jgi:predicted acyl esterase